MSRWGLKGALFVLIVVLTMTPVAASAQAAGDQGPAVLFLADQLTYDRERGITRASGNVEVARGERLLRADAITYDERLNEIVATGNVALLEPSGDVLFASRVELTGDLRDGVIEDIRVILADGARLAAAGGRRSAGVRSEMRKAVYSPCDLCPEDPDAPPLWQIKAVKVVHDEESNDIEYTDAWFEVAGLPVLYTPFLSHPDPTVERRTGFLAPGFENASDLGFVVGLPYYVVFSPQQDATITPVFSTNEGPALRTEYRHAFTNSRLIASGSITNDSNDDTRGHLFSEYRHDINRTWRGGLDINRTLDDTYLRRYRIDSSQTLTSRAFVEGFRRRNYAAANAYLFQALEADVDDDEVPIVAPLLDYNHIGEPDAFGGRTQLDLNVAVLTRKEGVDTRRLSTRGGWEVPLRGPVGDLLTLAFGVQADVYHVANQPDDDEDDGTFEGFTGRFHPQARASWRWPLIRDTEGGHQIIEPIGEFIIAPHGGNPGEIPNEDSQGFELDETNLFGNNRFSGHDRVEGGPRVNYGLRWAWWTDRFNADAFVGQSFRLQPDDTFAEGSGLEDNLSDIVAAVRIAVGELGDVNYRTRFDHNELDPRRHELSFSAGIPALRLNANYSFFDQQVDSEFSGREELNMTATSKLTRFWRASINSLRDLTVDDGQRSLGLTLVYEDECVIITTTLRRTFFEDRDVEPSDAVLFKVTLKTLGDLETDL